MVRRPRRSAGVCWSAPDSVLRRRRRRGVLPQGLLPLPPQLLGGLPGKLLPQVLAVAPLAHRGVDFCDELHVVCMSYVVEEVAGRAVAVVVGGPGGVGARLLGLG